jgi:hypothetical protein
MINKRSNIGLQVINNNSQVQNIIMNCDSTPARGPIRVNRNNTRNNAHSTPMRRTSIVNHNNIRKSGHSTPMRCNIRTRIQHDTGSVFVHIGRNLSLV